MKKLFILCAFSFFLLSCEKILNHKYYVEIDQNNKSEVLGDDFETKTEEITAKNSLEAYQKAYTSYMISKAVSDGTNTKTLEREIIDFRLLDENKNNITTNISSKSKDSIHAIVDKQTSHIAGNLKNQMRGHQNKIIKNEKIDSLELKNLRAKMKIEKDEFNGNYFFIPKNMPPYRNQKYLGFYFSGTSDSSTDLHFLMQYGAEDWLFIENIQLKIDDNVYDFTPDNIETKVVSGGIMEWFDCSIPYNKDFISAFENAKSVKYRLNGKQSYKEFSLTPSQIKKIQETLRLYYFLN